MTQSEQQKNAKIFAENWHDKGDEKQETQRYWIGLLGEVLGISSPTSYIEFEKRVKLSHTSFIDAYIPETKVLIEQKGIKIDLNKAYEQSDGTVLTPYQQAKRYANEMPYDLRPRWIVVSNFAEIHVHDMNKPNEPQEVIFLKDLEHDFYRLEFLVDRKNENIRREEEISLAAGKLVGKLYDTLIKEYINPTAESYRSLNILCVRLVFCFYAEDAGLFETRTSFEDYIKSFAVENVRDGLIKFFKALDTKLENRDKYDLKLKPFPYVNGGLFHDENIEIPNFTEEIINVLINDCASFDWHEISPTIFGAVFESTLNPETRRKGGMHYTSIENIHKVIDPLFLDDLNEEFDEIMGVAVNKLSLSGNHMSLQENRVSLSDNYMSLSGLTRQSVLKDSRVEHENDINIKYGNDNTAKRENDTNIKCENNKGGFDGAQPPRKTKNLSAKQRSAALLAFQKKLGSLTFLDPACGSGNFLTETYLSLRRLENKVISALNKGEKVLGFDEFIKVKISQFYGIEINDFAVTVAKTALWIAESQMINETEKIVSQEIDFLPLKTQANIVEGNALRMDWATFKNLDGSKTEQPMLFEFGGEQKNAVIEALETTRNEMQNQVQHDNHYDYIMGNPPFIGARLMTEKQKDDVLSVWGNVKNIGNVDYVSCWYKKAADLIKGTGTRCAFVSTNSITQGEQVAIMWKTLFAKGIRIDYAYRTFRWDSESSEKAHVHCVIVGFSGQDADRLSQRFIVSENGEKHAAHNINGYLLDAPDVFIESRSKPLCDVPEIVFGNMPNDGGNLIIEESEYDGFIKKEPNAEKFIRQFLGADEYINSKKRYCLWLKGTNPAELVKLPLVMERVKKVREMRLSSKRAATKKLAGTPWLFGEIRQGESGSYILIPRVSSEKRKYIPMGFFGCEVIASDAVQMVPNASLYDFGVLTSSVHMAWMRAVCGRLEMRYRYSAQIVYNNFVWCTPTDEQKLKIEKTAQDIIDARAKFPDSSLADMYGENMFMFSDLVKAHAANDKAVMQAYGFDPKMTEAEVVAELFKMYDIASANALK